MNKSVSENLQDIDRNTNVKFGVCKSTEAEIYGSV